MSSTDPPKKKKLLKLDRLSFDYDDMQMRAMARKFHEELESGVLEPTEAEIEEFDIIEDSKSLLVFSDDNPECIKSYKSKHNEAMLGLTRNHAAVGHLNFRELCDAVARLESDLAEIRSENRSLESTVETYRDALETYRLRAALNKNTLFY